MLIRAVTPRQPRVEAAGRRATPEDGYDLKAALGEGGLFGRTHISGMHTYHDAMLLASPNLPELALAEDIREAGARVAEVFGLPPSGV